MGDAVAGIVCHNLISLLMCYGAESCCQQPPSRQSAALLPQSIWCGSPCWIWVLVERWMKAWRHHHLSSLQTPWCSVEICLSSISKATVVLCVRIRVSGANFKQYIMTFSNFWRSELRHTALYLNRRCPTDPNIL